MGHPQPIFVYFCLFNFQNYNFYNKVVTRLFLAKLYMGFLSS